MVQLTPAPSVGTGSSLGSSLLLFLQPGHLQHLVQGTRLDFLRLVPSDRNEVGVIGVYILVMPFPALDSPAMLFYQLVEFGVLHDVKELLVN